MVSSCWETLVRPLGLLTRGLRCVWKWGQLPVPFQGASGGGVHESLSQAGSPSSAVEFSGSHGASFLQRLGRWHRRALWTSRTEHGRLQRASPSSRACPASSPSSCPVNRHPRSWGDVQPKACGTKEGKTSKKLKHWPWGPRQRASQPGVGVCRHHPAFVSRFAFSIISSQLRGSQAFLRFLRAKPGRSPNPKSRGQQPRRPGLWAGPAWSGHSACMLGDSGSHSMMGRCCFRAEQPASDEH